MENHNINKLLEYVTGELTGPELEKFTKHLNSCSGCMAEMKKIKNTMNILDYSTDELPSNSLLNSILADVSIAEFPAGKVPEKPIGLKIFHVALGIIGFISAVLLVNYLIPITLDWEELKSYWLFEILGRMGVSIAVVVAAGTFVSLSIMPVILFEQLKEKNI